MIIIKKLIDKVIHNWLKENRYKKKIELLIFKN
jgi:hypothetical protein